MTATQPIAHLLYLMAYEQALQDLGGETNGKHDVPFLSSLWNGDCSKRTLATQAARTSRCRRRLGVLRRYARWGNDPRCHDLKALQKGWSQGLSKVRLRIRVRSA